MLSRRTAAGVAAWVEIGGRKAQAHAVKTEQSGTGIVVSGWIESVLGGGDITLHQRLEMSARLGEDWQVRGVVDGSE